MTGRGAGTLLTARPWSDQRQRPPNRFGAPVEFATPVEHKHGTAGPALGSLPQRGQ